MADVVAIVALGLQYWLLVSIIDLHFGRVLPLRIAAAIFVSLAGVALAIWHKKKSWQTAKQWTKLILVSLVLGIAFFASDLLLAYMHDQTNPLLFPGGLLGIPLTLAISPGFTMICVAGLVRTFYIGRKEGGTG